MSVLNSRPVLRWIVPASAALAVIGGGAAIGALTAAADPSLPTRSAAQLLVDLQTARLDGLSGTVVARADLGLPALPTIGGQGSSDLTSLVSGTHTLRVWYSGPDKARVALLGTLGETDMITNGKDVWTWSSRDNTATHSTLPAGKDAKDVVDPRPTGTGFTPQQIADVALAALSPSTQVTTREPSTIAGRSAYELVLTPRDLASRIGSVRLAIDAVEHLPLRVQVFARGADSPAIEVAFTQISFARPDAAQFTFNPPPGAKVVEENATKPDAAKPDATKPDATKPDAAKKDDAARREARKDDAKDGPTVIGSGWTSVLVARLPEADAADKQDRSAFTRIIDSLPKVSGSWGSGRLLASSLFTVLVTDDGRVLVGAVSADRLYQAAADPAAKLSE